MKYLGKITDDKDLVTKEYVDDSIPDTSNFMVKGVDYVTAGKASGSSLGTKATAEGDNTTASGTASHAEGHNARARGSYSHAEGSGTASGSYSHAEGTGTTASGEYSHAEGADTTASGNYSHAEGSGSTAQGMYQHVFGAYNILDTAGSKTTKGAYVEIVGNGTANSSRSNARTLDWNGNETLAGNITIGNSATMQYNSTDKSIDFVFI